ncbi:hypothetical protein Cgig2_015044 [Carnegiea gigantea]|uniref:Uncharacterized protein n=1 Tax=Carnegiea gigantea TaxID=171969 RepID=A0A9Q1QE80_9CARY|nr:hypothetical protein Cgig2_015044 [Carnegiea gigantea]
MKEVHKNVSRVFGKAIFDKVSRTPFDGLPSLKGDFDSLYATILQIGVDVTLESKIKGLIKQACDFKDLQQSYFSRTSAEEHDSCRMEVQGKFDEAFRRLNTEGAYYEAKTAELKQGLIDIVDAAEVMDAATKASLEKAKAYIKESLEDLKNCQWDP